MEREFKKVTKEEFFEFVDNYPRKLATNFFMDWFDYYDFPEGFKPNSLEETYTHQVARHYIGMGGEEYYVLNEGKQMTVKEAIKILSDYEENGCGFCHQGGDEVPQAFEMAIKALEETEIKPPCGVKELLAERKRTNQQMLATISAAEFLAKINWLLHDYGKRYTDSRTAIIEWLNSEVKDET